MGLVRQLYAPSGKFTCRNFDNDDGPRIETVHSFCQSILRSTEAGVAPHVQLADNDEQSCQAMARAKMLYHPSPELAASVC